MKIILVLILFLTITAFGDDVPPRFLRALHQVESSGRLGAIKGDSGRALGPFQIHESYWQDSRVRGSYFQVTNYNYSVKVVTSYLNRYGAAYIDKRDWFNLARVHNGGPHGPRNASTIPYAKKVLSHMKD
jgi:hypothetical protein